MAEENEGFSKVSDPYLSDMVIDSIVRILSQGSTQGDNPNLWEILKSGVDQAPKLELLLATYSRSLDRRVGISHEVKANLFIKYALMNRLLAEFCRMLVQNETLLKKAYFPTSIVLSSEHYSMLILQLTTLECLDFADVWSEQGGQEKEEEKGPQKTLVLTASPSLTPPPSIRTSSSNSILSAKETLAETNDKSLQSQTSADSHPPLTFSLNPKSFQPDFSAPHPPETPMKDGIQDSFQQSSFPLFSSTSTHSNTQTTPSLMAPKSPLETLQRLPHQQHDQNRNPTTDFTLSEKSLPTSSLSSEKSLPPNSSLSSDKSFPNSTLPSTTRPSSDSHKSSSLFSTSSEPSFKFTSIYSKVREETPSDELTSKHFSPSSSPSPAFPPITSSHQTPGLRNSNPLVGIEVNQNPTRFSSSVTRSSLEPVPPSPKTITNTRTQEGEMTSQRSSTLAQGETKGEPIPTPNASQTTSSSHQTASNSHQTHQTTLQTTSNSSQPSSNSHHTSPHTSQSTSPSHPSPPTNDLSNLAIAAEVEAPPLMMDDAKRTELSMGHPPPPGSAKKRAKKRTIDL